MTGATPRNDLTGVVLAFVAAMAPPPDVEAQDDPGGAAQYCVRPSDIDRTKILDDRNVLFFMRNETVYQNVLPRVCPQLRSEGRFAYDKSGNRLCQKSSITVLVEFGIGDYVPGAVCRLGMFLPVTEDEVEDLLASSQKGKGDRDARSPRGPIEAKPVELPPDAAGPAPPAATAPQPAPGDAQPADAAAQPTPASPPTEPGPAAR